MNPYKPLLLTLLFGMLFHANLLAQQQHIQAILNSSPPSIELQNNSYMSYGCVEPTYILLQEILDGSDGYLDFYFSNLKSTDDISIGFEDATTGIIFYRYNFSNNLVYTQSDQEVAKAIIHKGRNNNLFRLEKCGDRVNFYQDGEDERDSKTLAITDNIVAKISVQSAEDVTLILTFEPDATSCGNDCTAQKSADLKAGDLMFVGYDNYTNGSETDRLIISNIVPLEPGTTFSLTNAALDFNEKWYSPNFDGQIAVQEIIYIGASTLTEGSIICFDVPHEGSGSSLLVRNFSINNVASDEVFCVKNNGNTPNSNLNIPTNQATALFLIQGDFKYSDTDGVLCGRALSGLQYGGDFLTGGQSVSDNSGFSHIPFELNCMAIEDGTAPANRHAFYSAMTAGMGVNRYDHLDQITDFSLWTMGTGDFPSNACASRSTSFNPLITDVSETTEAMEEALAILTPPTAFTSKVYPNPFNRTFTLELDITNTQNVTYRLVNVLGQTVLLSPSQTLGEGLHTIPINIGSSELAQTYFLHIRTAQESAVHILQRQVAKGTSFTH